jgi:hypothetical protein
VFFRRKARKQVYELTLADLRKFPVWEFALDEEGEAGQDEATVRPAASAPDGSGAFVVRTRFVATDGSEFQGFCTPRPRADLRHSQPSIVTARGHVGFWYGMFKPEPAEISKAYGILDKPSGSLFPMRFSPAVAAPNCFTEGAIPGFQWLESRNPDRVATLV